MKIAFIGGAGVRTPLLINGLTHSDLPIDRIALYDDDQERLSVIGRVAELMASRPERDRGATRSGRCVDLCDSVADCVSGADFVFTSIRVGGIAQRIHDETAAQRHGIVGQETVGPAGFAMAARTIPHMVRYAREIDRVAPSAWIINFTNPVGMVTEAMRTSSRRVIGICDTPTELFEDVARVLDLRSDECHFDYFGLNHLGWLREVYRGGVPQLHRLWRDTERLRAIYRVPMFEPSFLQELRLLPTEYVYYYDQPLRAFDNVQRAGRSRGQVIESLTTSLFEALKAPGVDRIKVYDAYLAARSAGYMQLESGSASPVTVPPPSGLAGYDRIALAVIRAVHFNLNAVIPLSVANRGTIPDLLEDDVVEVPCVVNANGALPMHAGPAPERVRTLLTHVKEYERRTVQAALAQSTDRARDALACNPLVPDRATADRLMADLSPLW